MLLFAEAKDNISTSHIENISQQVLDKLFKVNHNKRFGFTSPKVVVRNEKKAVAAFYPMKNEIILEVPAYEICRTFGIDSLSALAFILGHELAHSYQMEIIENKQQTNYMAHHKHYEGSRRLEKVADVGGAFNAYLAGFKTMGIISPLMAKLYDTYNLNDEIDNYPPRKERMNTADEVSSIVKRLVSIYESAAYLTSIGEYGFAAASYEHILEFYQGREIYNNLGVCYAMNAMLFPAQDIDLYLFPFELDQDSRIKKPKFDRGGKSISDLEKRVRSKYLKKALANLQEVASLDQTYFIADINIMCVKILQEDYAGAIEHYKTKGLKLRGEIEVSPLEAQRADMALAIAYAKSDQNEKATIAFGELIGSQFPMISYMAKYNERILLEGECGAPEELSCINPIDPEQTVDEVMLHRSIYKGNEVVLDEEDDLIVMINRKRNSTVFRYLKEGELKLTLQKIDSKHAVAIKDGLTEDKKIQRLSSNKGDYLICLDSHAVYRMNDKGTEVNEWAKFFYNY